jgi:hypothetical protein
MGRVSGRLARHGSFGHSYLLTIMMVLASVVTTSFAILLLFSLSPHASTSAPPHILGRGRRSRRLLHVFVRHRLAQWLCTSTRIFHIIRAPSFSPSSDVSFVFPAFPLFFHPNQLPPPTVTTASRPTLVDAGTGRVGHAPGLSPCVPSRRTWWRLPRLGYFSDEEFRSGILNN